jgi:hypothetical protein
LLSGFSAVGGAQLAVMIKEYIKVLKVMWVFLPIDRSTGTPSSGFKTAFKELPNFYSCMGVKQIGELSSAGIHFSTISLVESYESCKVSSV